eukprot:Amastigsp_a4682_156.p3 type:complete len:117 gc:universal Amastigsp_a4682_156:409-59(-)
MSAVAASMSPMYDSGAAPRLAFTRRNMRLGKVALSSTMNSSKSLSLSATSTTLSPWAARRSVRARPMPDDAPVTSAHLASYFFFRSCSPKNHEVRTKGSRNVYTESEPTRSSAQLQ